MEKETNASDDYITKPVRRTSVMGAHIYIILTLLGIIVYLVKDKADTVKTFNSVIYDMLREEKADAREMKRQIKVVDSLQNINKVNDNDHH